MVEIFNNSIETGYFETIQSFSVIRNKNFLNEVISSHNLIELTFAHLPFLESRFIDINFMRTSFFLAVSKIVILKKIK